MPTTFEDFNMQWLVSIAKSFSPSKNFHMLPHFMLGLEQLIAL
jgi:hypothetical protein